MLPIDCADWLTSRSAIDRAGDGYRKDPTNYANLRGVQCYRLFRVLGFNEVIDKVLGALPRQDVLVAARLKRLPTIVRKLSRESGMQLSRMADVLGVRIVCSSLSAAREVAEAIKQIDWYNRSQEYWDSPRATGYRAFHALLQSQQLGPNGQVQITVTYEVQVRSFYQHLWALVSESFGEQVKEGGGPSEVREYLVELSQAIAAREAEHPDEQQAVFENLPSERGLLLVKSMPDSAPSMMLFGNNYQSAMNHLVGWEEGSNATGDSLLLVGVGDVKKLATTHATFFLGRARIPLPHWMPSPPTPS